METYELTHEDIQFIAEAVIRLQQSNVPFNAETVAQEILAGLIISNIRNERD